MLNFRDDGVMLVGLTAFETRHEARANGFKWMAPILAHDPTVPSNENDIRVHAGVYRSEGWQIAGWATYGYAATPETDAQTAVRQVVALGLEGWIANGEAWAEGAQIGYSQRFIDAWFAAGGRVPLAVSCLSSETDQWAREFDYAAWLKIGSLVMPQVYGNDIPGLTVHSCLGTMGKGGVPETSLSLTFGTYDTGRTIPYADYQGWSGPRGIYVGDRTASGTWPQLARGAARPGTPPNEEEPMEWWQQPYPTGDPVYAGALPYPLYPPDAAPGKTPTPDCPLAVAVKRAVSRLGRWKWTQFDDSYSNGFAHGKGGNVIDTGVAGVQRQHLISDSGWVGKATFDLLVRARIPAGLAHAGEPACDSVAVDLIRQAASQGPPGTGVPALGPVVRGGASVLDQDLTHATGGLDGYPAFDDGWEVGKECVAPEDMEVTRHGSSQGGEALYAAGATIDWWFGHIVERAPVGATLKKGDRFGVIAPMATPHLHTGLNTQRLLGHELAHHTDYTHGAPTVGRQLEEALL